MVKYIYTIFIGILLATSIGVGIAAFYPAPQAPEYPREVITKPTSGEPTPADLEEQRKFDQDQRAYEKQARHYNRNVALISVGFSIVILILSLVLMARIQMLADGLMLGGVFTLIYGIGRSFGSGEQKFMFAMTTFGLVVAMILGYIKFIKPEKSR
jgi:hypothetical protein